ncbi:HAD family hydrolase [Methanoplanus limicola]|uniref:Haloacid dehalogenase domain protein hydrolase n=1 Tax=Methanoplanus limicola DSM 2279 TaxID=937775 RepID=H1YZ86_9EURY|nr:HAD-IA family hydrolase [Methanoplanus limicola]EHQ35110.1 Haloacid dehalogenase domain protein hydrolase [Methanoplanus limicola DSM 2279]
MIDLIILDFDGVILESVSAKTKAFSEIFSGEKPEDLKKIIDYHLENGGMPRFDKFRHIYAEILNKELTDEKIKELSENFEKIVKHEVINSPFVSGAEEFLSGILGKVPLYVVSATPQDEIREIIKEKGINRYFNGVFGSPETKASHIRKILEDTGVKPENAVFIGDAKNDWKAAVENKVRFIGRVCDQIPDTISGLPDVETIVEDLKDFEMYVKAYML